MRISVSFAGACCCTAASGHAASTRANVSLRSAFIFRRFYTVCRSSVCKKNYIFILYVFNIIVSKKIFCQNQSRLNICSAIGFQFGNRRAIARSICFQSLGIYPALYCRRSINIVCFISAELHYCNLSVCVFRNKAVNESLCRVLGSFHTVFGTIGHAKGCIDHNYGSCILR